MKKRSTRCIAVCVSAAALALASACFGQTQALTFDDICPADPELPVFPIPDGYGGFHWESPFIVVDEILRAWMLQYGIEIEGVVSGDHAAYIHNWQPSYPVSIWRDGSFNFEGAYLTSGRKNRGYLTYNITVQGWANGTLVYTQTVELNNQAPTWCDFDYHGIDKLVFSSDSQTCLVVDDFTFNLGTEIEVDIDIKPGVEPDSINLKSNGVAPVAVLTTDDFIALTVDPGTVFFADAEPVRWTDEDVDGDGDLDLLLHFRIQDLNLTATSTEATLAGETWDGIPIKGTDSVRIVPASSKGK